MMARLVKPLSIAASVAASTMAIAIAPAFAGTLAGASIRGIALAEWASSEQDRPIDDRESVNSTDKGVTGFLYGFAATSSGFVGGEERLDENNVSDPNSNRSNLDILNSGTSPEKVPEPSAIFGLVGLAGFLAFKRKLVKNA